jgi:hypothetical protein
VKAITVPASVIAANGLRLDCQPYMDAAFDTPATIRAQAKSRARHAYFRAARKGIRQALNLEQFHREHGLDAVGRLT